MSSHHALDLDAIEERFRAIVAGTPWRQVEDAARASETTLILANGGNLAIAQHGATDLTLLTGKRVIAPGSAVTTTAIANEVGFERWLGQWVTDELRGTTAAQREATMVLGLSCSGVSPAVMDAMHVGTQLGATSVLLTAKQPATPSPAVRTVTLGAAYYHSAEIIMQLLLYQLAVAQGASLRRIE